jgi:hypothetical protein
MVIGFESRLRDFKRAFILLGFIRLSGKKHEGCSDREGEEQFFGVRHG